MMMWFYVAIGILFLAALGYIAWQVHKGKGERVDVSFILQRDDCSRLVGEFNDQHLHQCSKLIIVWKNGTDDIQIVTSQSVQDTEAAGMLLVAAHTVGEKNGC